MANPIASASV